MNKIIKKDGEIFHYGVLGMRWGVRKDPETGATRSTERLVNKDVKRYSDAKMYYGKGAGTRRKLLYAELDKKKKDIPGYKALFDKKVQNANYARSAKKAKVERTTRDTVYRTRVTVKQFLGITGPLTVAAATYLYYGNKDTVDRFVSEQFKKAVSKFK